MTLPNVFRARIWAGVGFASLLASLHFGPSALLAQTKPAPRVINLIVNGNFERSSQTPNLWDGVDNTGKLATWRRTVPALVEAGGVGELLMPASVAAGDLTGNGLIDLVVASPIGYFMMYINSGTPEEAKFTHGELIPIFLSAPERGVLAANIARLAPKITLADFNGSGRLDLIVGLYDGTVLFIPNSGTPLSPKWDQPRSLETAEIKLDGNRPSRNIIAPTVADWTDNGRPDLLLGEGSYSANSIRLFENSRGGTPNFSGVEAKFAAYGEGREQLTPTVADLNGDGKLDLVIGDRRGEIALYLNPGNLEPGEPIPFSSVLTFGNTRSFGGCAAPLAVDWNKNGLIDLVVGKANGRMALALNSGTKEEPKFGTPVELEGEAALNNPIRLPSGWTSATGMNFGGAYSSISCVDATMDPKSDPPEGKFVLRLGYEKSPNKILSSTSAVSRQSGDVLRSGDQLNVTSADTIAAGPTHFAVQQTINRPILVGKTYELTFKYRADKIQAGKWDMVIAGSKVLSEDQRATGVRVDAVTTVREQAQDSIQESGDLRNTSSWTEVTKKVTVRFRNRDLADLERATSASILIQADISNPEGALYLDDFVLTEVQSR